MEYQNQVYLKGVKYSKFGHRLPNWPSLGLSFIRNLNETTNPLTDTLNEAIRLEGIGVEYSKFGHKLGYWP